MVKSDSFKFNDHTKSINNALNSSNSEYMETEEDIFMTKEKD